MKLAENKTLIQIVFGAIFGGVLVALSIFISLPDRMAPVVLLPTSTLSPLKIYVAGAVKNPGVINIPNQSRVQDAILAAGGVTDDANLASINLAAFITDGQKLSIPSFNEPQQQIQTDQIIDDVQTVSINSATLKELEELPGIGEEKAKAILSEREKRGGFHSIDELLLVPGINQNLFDKIKSQLSL